MYFGLLKNYKPKGVGEEVRFSFKLFKWRKKKDKYFKGI